MKVGIITFNRAINYGAVLQAYALKNYLISEGYDAEDLNYINKNIEETSKIFSLNQKSLKDLLIMFALIPTKILMNRKFKIFTKNYLGTSNTKLNDKNIKEINEKFDAFISGSDQVWNYEITGLDENYFLEFATKDKVKISYAASFGVDKIPDEYWGNYKRLLGNFDMISVREKTGVENCNKILGINPITTVDPVFLINKEMWEKMAIKPKIKRKYVLVYSLNKSNCYEIARKIAKDKDLEVVVLQPSLSCRIACKKVKYESPEEFLGFFYNAEYIVTDSFHGTAFSAIFEKKFIMCTGGNRENRASRQKMLLELLGLEERIGNIENYTLIYDDIDYEVANNNFEKYVKQSKEFLVNSLNNGGKK